MKKHVLLSVLATISVAHAKNGDATQVGRTETQVITCGLQFPGATQWEALQSVEVKNSEARLFGQSRNFKYAFSVAGKTGLGKITDLETNNSVVAKGAIEMLSHGGRTAAPTPAAINPLRRGDDDGRDGQKEREGGFDLAINSAQGNIVTLKCENHKQKTTPNSPAMASVTTGALWADAVVQAVPSVANCAEADYVTVPAGTPSFTVTTKGSTYSPRCLKVSKGTKVLIEASPAHPLQGIEAAAGTVANPIFDELGATSNTKTVDFTAPGFFGYYCVAHGSDRGQGMAGSIWVIE